VVADTRGGLASLGTSCRETVRVHVVAILASRPL